MSEIVPLGVTGARSLRYWAHMLGDPLETYSTLWREYGDAVRLPLTPKHGFFLLTRPEYAEHVLVGHQDRYQKGFTYRPFKAFLGDGLLTKEGAVWERHRRLVQPMFSHRHVQSFAPAIVEATRNRVAQWAPGTTIDIAAEMRALTMDVIGRVLFGTDLSGDAAPVGRAMTLVQSWMVVAAILPTSLPPERLRAVATRIVPGLGETWRALHSLIARIIDARIGAPHEEPSDLLDLLLSVEQDEQRLSRAEIQAEAMTLLCAGHETTANALAWALTLLSRYPAAHQRLVAEVDEVLGSRDPQAPDIDALPWACAVVSETMRLHPPAWHVERDAVQDDDIAGVSVSAGDTVGISPYLLHRHPEFWPNPEGFDPQRFLPDGASSRPRYAYLPFGGGRRICVGAGLAQLEVTLALVVLAQSARVDLVPTAPLRPRADVTLRPRGPVLATVTPARSLPRSSARSGAGGARTDPDHHQRRDPSVVECQAVPRGRVPATGHHGVTPWL
jgi:cytochrome P450